MSTTTCEKVKSGLCSPRFCPTHRRTRLTWSQNLQWILHYQHRKPADRRVETSSRAVLHRNSQIRPAEDDNEATCCVIPRIAVQHSVYPGKAKLALVSLGAVRKFDNTTARGPEAGLKDLHKTSVNLIKRNARRPIILRWHSSFPSTFESLSIPRSKQEGSHNSDCRERLLFTTLQTQELCTGKKDLQLRLYSLHSQGKVSI